MVEVGESVYLLISIILGACVGSFLNVVIYRLPLKLSVVFPASHCPLCKVKIKPYHNIPLLSYILLGGRCRYCGGEIAFRYFVVEISTAFCFFITLYFNAFQVDFVLLRNLVFCSFGIAIFFIDLKHFIVPDVLSLPLLVLGVGFAFLCPEPSWQSALGSALAGFSMFFLVAWGYEKWRGKMGLGGGDIKYIAGIGAFVGVYGLLFVMFFSALLALLVFGFVAIKSRRSAELPFAPFMTVSAFVYVLVGKQLLGILFVY